MNKKSVILRHKKIGLEKQNIQIKNDIKNALNELNKLNLKLNMDSKLNTSLKDSIKNLTNTQNKNFDNSNNYNYMIEKKNSFKI